MRSFVWCLVIVILPGSFVHLNAQQSAAPKPQYSADEISGMYAFLREGEFVQISVDNRGHVTGFVSRFGDLESDRGAFLDQFFKTASLDGDRVAFKTETVHGAWFEFSGKIQRGPAKDHTQDGYYVLKGTLTQYTLDANKESAAKKRDVELKSFPQDSDLGVAHSKRD